MLRKIVVAAGGRSAPFCGSLPSNKSSILQIRDPNVSTFGRAYGNRSARHVAPPCQEYQRILPPEFEYRWNMVCDSGPVTRESRRFHHRLQVLIRAPTTATTLFADSDQMGKTGNHGPPQSVLKTLPFLVRFFFAEPISYSNYLWRPLDKPSRVWIGGG